MKLLLIFLFTALVSLSQGFSQKTDLLNQTEYSNLSEILNSIETQSNMLFAYRNTLTPLLSVKENKKTESNILLIKPNQPVTVGGAVTNSDGDPLTGVTVVVKGTTNGTISDVNGAYSLSNVPSNGVLVFSFIGLRTLEVGVDNRITINVVMEEDAIGLEEVVAIGYGTRQRKDLTSSITSVGEEILEKVQMASPEFALQGNTTGVRIVNTSGDPGAAPQIYVRGIGTWVGESQPLYVIDGQIIIPPKDDNIDVITGDNMDTPPNLWTLINPNDIESISVLKDASAAAIYGSRAANGVVLITTKRGKAGKAVLEFDVNTSIQNIPTYDMLNTQQYVDIVNEMYANNTNPDIILERDLYGREVGVDTDPRVNFSPQFDPDSPYYISSRETYDWQDELVRSNAMEQNYNLRVSGASDKTNYYISGSYKNQEGVFYGNDLERYTGTVNLSTEVTKWLRTGVNYRFAKETLGMDDYTDLPGLTNNPPWQPLRDPNNRYGFAEVIDPEPGNWQPVKIYGRATNDNYLALAHLNRRSFDLMRNMGNIYAEIMPFSGLTLRGSLNLDYASQDRNGVNTFSRANIFQSFAADPATEAPAAPNSLGSFASRVNNIFNYQADFIATYDKVFDKHRITVTGVIQDQYNTREFRDFSGSNLNNITDLDRIGYGNDLANNTSIYGKEYKYWFSYAGRANYIYDNTYYLDFSFRRDGSSGFIKDYRWGSFFSVSAAWRLTNYSFLEDNEIISDLKLRGGWGEAGNDEPVAGKYYYLSLAAGAGSYRFGSGLGDAIGNYFIAVPVAGFPNKELTWEVASTYYGGFDAYLFNNRVNMTFEIFNRRTIGIIQEVDFPLSVGTFNPRINIGVMENRGVDLLLGYNNSIGPLTFSISGNISFLKNEVVEIYAGTPLEVEDDYGNERRVEEGRSIGHIWGYKLGGIFQDEDDITTYFDEIDAPELTIDNIAPGDMYFQDIGGDPTEDEPYYSTTPDQTLNNYDQTEIGNTIPGHTYGINIQGGLFGLDVYMSWYGEGNVDKFNDVRQELEGMHSDGSNYLATTLDRWTLQNTNTDLPRAIVDDPAGNNRISDRFVESAAFFRLNSWQIGYTLPDKVYQSINYSISSFRIYVGGQNNLYFFKWSGVDPVNDRKPLLRSFNIGINAKF